MEHVLPLMARENERDLALSFSNKDNRGGEGRQLQPRSF